MPTPRSWLNPEHHSQLRQHACAHRYRDWIDEEVGFYRCRHCDYVGDALVDTLKLLKWRRRFVRE